MKKGCFEFASYIEFQKKFINRYLSQFVNLSRKDKNKLVAEFIKRNSEKIRYNYCYNHCKHRDVCDLFKKSFDSHL